MTPPEFERIDGIPIARLREDVDAATAPRTERALANALHPDALSLIVDLAEVRYLDSAGIDMLLRLGQRLGQRRAQLLVVIPDGSRLIRVAEIVGLKDAVPVHSTLAAALDAAKSEIRRPAPRPQPDGSAVS